MSAIVATGAGEVMAALPAFVAQITDPGVNTDFPGYSLVNQLLGNLKWLALAGCLGSLFIGGMVWGLANAGGNSGGSVWGRRFALGGAVGAVIVGLGAQIVNTFSSVS